MAAGSAGRDVPVVLSVLGRPPTGRPAGVLAACDGSDGSLWALDRAMTEAELFGLPLYVLAVVNPAPAGYPPGMAELVQESVERWSRARRTACAVRWRPCSGSARRRTRGSCRCTWCWAT